MFKYAIYTIYTDKSGEPIIEFEDAWRYAAGDKIFLHGQSDKRLYVISHITHDVNEDGSTIHRLYCQEKKAH